MTIVSRIQRVVLNTVDAAALSTFYVDVLGFRVVDIERRLLGLGPTRLELRDVGPTAHRYPGSVAGWDSRFQHCAIVVTAMQPAMDALQAATGWSAISTAGPEQLPAGGIVAFKFRDPEGHPLEFLWLADEPAQPDRRGPFVRIDHSAISVADVERSIDFYEALGLRVAGRSLNVGVEQQRMDDVPDATVDVITLALRDAHAKPHLELLGYRGDHPRAPNDTGPDDIAATRLVFATSPNEKPSGPQRDPDGHWLSFEAG